MPGRRQGVCLHQVEVLFEQGVQRLEVARLTQFNPLRGEPGRQSEGPGRTDESGQEQRPHNAGAPEAAIEGHF